MSISAAHSTTTNVQSWLVSLAITAFPSIRFDRSIEDDEEEEE
jgi:hypothetical protein